MTALELAALPMIAVLSGIKSTYGLRLWHGREITITGVWKEKCMYALAGAWLLLYGLIWFLGGRSMEGIRLWDFFITYGILALVDGKRRIVPTGILVCYLAGQMLLGAFLEAPSRLFFLFITGGIFGAVLALVSRLSGGRIGMGDVKLLGVTAMTTGYMYSLQIFILAMAVSFLYSIYLLLFKKAGMQTEFPFVPFLAVGAAVSFLIS